MQAEARQHALLILWFLPLYIGALVFLFWVSTNDIDWPGGLAGATRMLFVAKVVGVYTFIDMLRSLLTALSVESYLGVESKSYYI